MDGPGLEGKGKIQNKKCDKVIGKKEATPGKSGVIHKVISFVEGGTTAFAAKTQC
ncbi:unnamed protein product [Staurois parvus]|uniref:Uncharacterized protein n=1 Tax=Staurois parvus TaxID=386267 RepID=A0ABN9DDT7_9NEOB|nr:unnamed protein product [Staurois parvus]